jgi:hypothetical protein
MNTLKTRPIFILGMARSGTTLIRSILNSHPNIAIPRETSFFYLLDEFLKKTRKNSISDYNKNEFWKWYSNKRRFKYLDLDPSAVKRDIDFSRDQGYFKNVFQSVMDNHMKNKGKIRWAEKTPGHELYLNKIFEFYPDAKIIFMIRDPRAVYASLKKVPWGVQFVSVAIKRWNSSLKILKTYKNDKRIIGIRYEDLVSDSERIVKSICNFLEEDYNEEILNERKKLTNSKGSNWTSKYELEVSRGIDSNSLEKWKNELTDFQISAIENYCDKESLNTYYDSYGKKMSNLLKFKYFAQKSKHYITSFFKG